MSGPALVVMGLFGLIAGSFGAASAYRVPIGKSMQTRSACPRCGVMIRPIENIPLLSFALLRGRCRSCHERIPIRYPAMEALTAGLFVAVGVRLHSSWVVPAYCVLTTGLVILSAIDLEHHRLPRPVVYLTAVLGAPLLVLASAGTHRWSALLAGFISGAVAFGAFLLIHLLSPRGMGFGDVRLAGLCGAFLGWIGYRTATVGLLAGIVLAGLFAVVLIAAGRAGRKTQIPLGPYIAAGTMLGVLYGPTIASYWLPR